MFELIGLALDLIDPNRPAPKRTRLDVVADVAHDLHRAKRAADTLTAIGIGAALIGAVAVAGGIIGN